MILKRGSKGEAVKELQELLNAAGYDCGKADGVFGAKTETAVRAFQTDHNLTVDGIAGDATIQALKSGSQPSEEPSQEPADIPDPPVSNTHQDEETVTIVLSREMAETVLRALQAATGGR